jgi:hypothetical protein
LQKCIVDSVKIRCCKVDFKREDGMNKFTWLRTIILFVPLLTAQAETINLKGVVSNKTGNPVSGAVVTLSGLKMADTTDANGKYVFSQSAGVLYAATVLPVSQRIALTNGLLSISLTVATPLSIELFDMRGQLLDRVVDRSATSGEYHFDVTHHRCGTQMLLLRVNVGDQTSIVRYLPLSNGWNSVAAVRASAPGSMLAKIKAATDTLKVIATGFTSVAVAIDSYQGEKNISLDSETTLENFSFFVTSMKGLQELSGSENGFGGDFRFGKTGQGAGLLGADSICQCLAEKSMPGSKAKVWSAFLSATKGVDGQEVNAIDRIGEGPWYDRLGRLVANKKSELLAVRPSSADAAIINDLPNEYGIPNHRPDPTKAVVDNHMTITGSDSLGKLYKGGGSKSGSGTNEDGYTCDDWTSTTLKSGPRVGLSWPQSASMKGGMKHWISAMTASGCEPGYDLNESTMSGVKGVYTIGNGGGYGGFYCFAHKP